MCARAVVRINKLTGRVLKEFNSIHAAAFAYGESDKMVRDQCKLNKLSVGWECFRYADSYTADEQLESKRFAPVMAYDGVNLLAFANRADASRALETNRDVLGRKLRDGTPIEFNGALVYVREAPRMGIYKGVRLYECSEKL